MDDYEIKDPVTIDEQDLRQLLDENRRLREAAEIDYKRAKRACEHMKAEDELCRMYADYGEECMYCPLEWVATIEEVLR